MKEIISKNFQHHIAHIPAQTNGMQVVHLENLSYVDSGLSCDTFNIIHIHNQEDGLTQEELTRAIRYFSDRSSDYCIWITAEARTALVKALFSESGIVEQANEIGMILDLDAYTPQANEMHDNVVVVNTVTQIADYAHVIAENWTPPDQNVLAFYQNSASQWLNPSNKMILLVYYWEGKAVSCVELCPSDESTIGLYGFATLAAFRGRGIGSTLMNYSLNLAKQQGFKKAVLQATEDGMGIYKKMGFQSVTTFYEYA